MIRWLFAFIDWRAVLPRILRLVAIGVAAVLLAIVVWALLMAVLLGFGGAV